VKNRFDAGGGGINVSKHFPFRRNFSVYSHLADLIEMLEQLIHNEIA
jgi:hypothetical protein